MLYVLSGTTTYGGATKAFLGLLENIKKANIEVSVLCPDTKGIYSFLLKSGIPIVVSDVRFTIWPSKKGLINICLFLPRIIYRSFLNIVAYNRLLRFAKQEKPDIIHTNVSIVNIGYKVAKKLGIPHVWHVREYGDADFNFKFAPSYSSFLNQLNDKCNYCITITNGVKLHHGLNDGKSVIIYDGVLSEKCRRYNPKKKNYFLFAGRLEEAKGIDLCIRAYVNSYNNNHIAAELWVAGNAIDKNYYDYIKNLAGETPVKFLGMRQDIYELMYEAKALIVPSRNEGFGFITAEAMFNGCLVLGMNTGGTKEQMDNGLKVAGQEIALRFETEEELSKLIDKVDKDQPSKYEEMIMAGQNVAVGLYSTERHSKQVIDLYKKIVSS